mgnify:CR=1 FL=1
MARQSKVSRRGKALPLTDADLDALAEITDADILRAQQEARRLLSRQYKNLLQAVIDDDPSSGRPVTPNV